MLTYCSAGGGQYRGLTEARPLLPPAAQKLQMAVSSPAHVLYDPVLKPATTSEFHLRSSPLEL